MPCGDGARGGGCGVNVGKYFHEGRAVPGFAVEGALELVNDELDLRHALLPRKKDFNQIGSSCGSDIPVRRMPAPCTRPAFGHGFWIEASRIKSNSKIKSIGQECPTHTGFASPFARLICHD